MKRVIALAALLAGGLLIASPTAGAAEVCPPGTTGPSAYCAAAAAPTVVTGNASEITDESATLTGTVNPNGDATTVVCPPGIKAPSLYCATVNRPTTYYFEYGTTTSYGSRTPTATLSSSTTATAVSAGVQGLEASTTYHYRLVASNGAGTSYGADMTFETVDKAGIKPFKIHRVVHRLTRFSLTVKVTCNHRPFCRAKVILRRIVFTASAKASASVIYGRGKYSLAYGQEGNVKITLTAAGRKTLKKTGKLAASVVAVSGKTSTVIGTVKIAVAHTKHVTHAKAKPGFTG